MSQYLCKMCLFSQHSNRFVQKHKDSLPTKEGKCGSCEREKTLYDTSQT